MLFSLYRLGCPVAKTVAARLRKIPNINRSVLKKRAACIGTVQNEGDWAQPNKHFATQKWRLYRQKPCLLQQCVLFVRSLKFLDWRKTPWQRRRLKKKLSTLIRFCLTAGIICALRATPARSLKSVISPAVQPRSSQKGHGTGREL